MDLRFGCGKQRCQRIVQFCAERGTTSALCSQSNERCSDFSTHVEKLDPTVQRTTRRKYGVPISPDGKFEISSIEINAQASRVHIASSHCMTRKRKLVIRLNVLKRGRIEEKGGKLTGLKGLSPVLHFAAKYPNKIWNGKSIKTASARSSFLSPFSNSLSEVAASFAAVPSLVTR